MRGFDHAVKAINYIHNNRCWTVRELMEYVGVSKKHGYVYLNILSEYYPVRPVRTIPNDHPNGAGVRPMLYTIYPSLKRDD